MAILFIVLCFVFTIYISDTYITTIYANIINTEVEHRVVSCILTSETISSVETDRGSWTYSTIEYGSELNEFVKSLRNNWISPLIFLFASTVTLWYTSDWGTNIVHALQLCVAVGAPLIVVFGNIQSRKKVEQLTMERYSNLDDIYQNARTVLSHDGTSQELSDLKKYASTQNNADISLALSTISTIIIPCALVVMMLFFCSILLVRRLNLTRLETTTLLLVLTQRLYYVGVLVQSGQPTMVQYSLLTNLADKFKHRSLTVDTATKLNVENCFSGIQFHNVSFSYLGSEVPIVLNCSIHFPLNSGTALLGMSGSGKSTVLNLIKGFLSPSKGNITLNGILLENYEHRNRVVGLVMQSPQIFNKTVWENIGYGYRHLGRNEIENKLREKGWYDMLKQMGLDLDIQTGKGGDRLSGGQKQIVQLLRVLILDPLVLLLDEPTAALDDDNRNLVMSFIASITKSKVVIMVTHDKQLVSYMDRVIDM